MMILLSPAKSLDFESLVPAPPQDQGLIFDDEHKKLAVAAGNLSKKRLKEIMPVSDKLIDLNYFRYRNFFDQPERAAIYAFSGDVYQGFAARTLSDKAQDFAQRHVRILSGLYGLLRPLDPIRPYRLEMGTRWAPRHTSLVSFWGDKIAREISLALGSSANRTVINLASQEYFAAVQSGRQHLEEATIAVIDVDFRRETDKGLKFVSFDAKRARGMMARFICDHEIADVEGLKSFDWSGYRFVPEQSTGTSLLFARKS